MALHSCLLPPLLPDWDWDWDWELPCTLGDGIHGDAFTGLPSCGESPVSSSSEASSGGGGGGYLEDAVAHWSDRCKRQRTAAAEEEAAAPAQCPAMASEDLQSLLQSFWDSSSDEGDLLHDSKNIMAPGPEQTSGFPSEVDDDASGWEKEQLQGPPSTQALGEGEGEAGEEAATAAGPRPPPFSGDGQRAPPGSSPLQRLQKATTGRGSHYCEPASSSSSSSMAGKRDGGGVVYPFAVVKPLVLDGSTLSDVNRRILKRPARPVPHPVGQFAYGPAVASAHGPGMSGKAVMSLTRIRTGGKGTITIIRTRG